MALDFVKNASNYLTYGTGALGTLCNGSSKLAVSALIRPDSYSTTSPTNNENCVFRIMVDGSANMLTLRVEVAGTPRVHVTARSIGTDAAQNVTGTTGDLSAGSWHHIGALLDIAGDSISPVADGVIDNQSAVTFGSSTIVLGTPTEPDRIGAHSATPPSTDDQFDGIIAECAIWDLGSAADFTAQEWLDLGAGFSPLLIRPHNLVFYAPLLRSVDDRISGVKGTITGSLSYIDHPRIYMPARRRAFNVRPPVTTPLALGASLVRRPVAQRQGNLQLPILHTSGGSSFTDDFTGDEDDTLESRTGWTRVDGVAGGAKINAANQVKNTTTTETTYTAQSAGSADHYAQVTTGTNFHTGGFTSFGPCVRVTDKNNWIGVRANGSTLQVFKRVAGTFTELAGISDSVTAGDTLRLEISGSTAKLIKNGSQIGSDMTVSDFSTVETPGVLCRTSTQASWFDNWESGALDGGGGTTAGGISRTATVATASVKIVDLLASIVRRAVVQRQANLPLATVVKRTVAVILEEVGGPIQIALEASLSRVATVAREASLSLPASIVRTARVARSSALAYLASVVRSATVALETTIAPLPEAIALAVSRGFEVAVQIVLMRQRVFRGGVGLGMLMRRKTRWKSRGRVKWKPDSKRE